MSDTQMIEITTIEQLNEVISRLNANDPAVQGIEFTDQFVDRFNDLSVDVKKELTTAFTDALVNNQTLKVLIDQSRTIDTQTLAKALKKNNTLKELCLGLEVGDLKFLAETFEFNKSIEKLDLDDNPYDKEGLIQLAKTLKTNTTLNELELRNNGITDEVALFFAEALIYNDIMLILDLDRNDISPVLEHKIQSMLNNNEMSDDDDIRAVKSKIFKPFEEFFARMILLEKVDESELSELMIKVEGEWKKMQETRNGKMRTGSLDERELKELDGIMV